VTLAARVGWWLRDLVARCAYCRLRLPLVPSDRKSWRFEATNDPAQRWVCPFCRAHSLP
jgi:hypothetical protein